MSQDNLPFGWNERRNGVNILPDAPPAGDWRAYNMGQKFEMSREKERNNNLPFGWEDSTNVAVAEVNLLDLEKARERRLAEAEAALQPLVPGSTCSPAAITAALQPQLSTLTSSISHMDARLHTLESNVATIMKQQEMIIKLLVEQSNTRIQSQI